MQRPFDEMPDHARVWVFAVPRPLEKAEARRLLEHADDFVAEWTAHGHPVVGGYRLQHDQFLLVAADEQATGVSGCSIDSLFRRLKQAEGEIGVSLLDNASRVWYRDASGQIHSVPRGEFRERAKAGEVDGDTVVFDNTVSTVGELRASGWERPMRESWHAQAFTPA